MKLIKTCLRSTSISTLNDKNLCNLMKKALEYLGEVTDGHLKEIVGV